MKPGFSPLKYASVFAVIYLVGSIIYVHFTHWLVTIFASSAEEFGRLTAMKATIFVVAKAVLLFFFTLMVFRTIARRAEQLVESQRRLLQAERDAIPGMIASSIAHDCTNLLTLLRYNIDKLRDLGLPPKSEELALTIDNGISRLADMSARLHNAGKSLQQNGPVAFEIGASIEETLRLLRVHQVIRGCEIEVVASGRIVFKGYPILVHQLLMNLILNAAQSAGEGGHLVVRAKRRADSVMIEVHDNGPGISPEIEGRVFDAFFTTKSNGTGLGLLSVKSCVEIHGGSVTIGKSELGGAAFSVSLPDLTASSDARFKSPESLNKTTSPPVSYVPRPMTPHVVPVGAPGPG